MYIMLYTYDIIYKSRINLIIFPALIRIPCQSLRSPHGEEILGAAGPDPLHFGD